MRRSVARLAAASTVGLLVTALVGCGDDEPTGPGASGSTSGSGDPSPSDDPSAATGPEVTTGHVTLNLPDDWRQERLSAGSTSASAEPKDESDVSSIRITDLEVAGGAYPLGRLARDSIDLLGSEVEASVQTATEVAGVEVYHVSGEFGRAIDVDEFGPSVDGAIVAIRFELYTLNSTKQNEAIIESVLASVEWDL